MSNVPSSHARSLHPADRCFGIMQDLRSRIVSGELQPGARLPTRRDLAEACQTTLVTVQKALSRLESAGFVSSRGRDGSYVADRPPHLFRFGMVFAELPTTGSAGWYWSKYWSLIARIGTEAAEAQGRELTHYSGIANWAYGEDAKRLTADIEQHRLAGLITAGPIGEESPLARLISTHQIPTVQIASAVNLPTMSITYRSPLKLVIDRLLQIRCQNLAMLMPEFIGTPEVDQTLSSIRSAGVAIQESRIIGLDPREPRWIRNWVRLLVESARPPQALWITDDNLLEQAVLGLNDAGVVIGRDMEVIAHANFPLDTPNPAGVIRYGVNARQLMDLTVDMLVNAVGETPRGARRKDTRPATAPTPRAVAPEWMDENA